MTLPPTGRRKRTAPVNSGVMGWVFVVHLHRPIGEGRARVAQAQHYIGWCERDRLVAALAELAAGTHCKLMAEAARLGIAWELASFEPGDRNRERQLKQNSATRHCLICRAQRKLRAARETMTKTQEMITDGGTPEGADRPELDASLGVAAGAAA